MDVLCMCTLYLLCRYNYLGFLVGIVREEGFCVTLEVGMLTPIDSRSKAPASDEMILMLLMYYIYGRDAGSLYIA